MKKYLLGIIIAVLVVPYSADADDRAVLTLEQHNKDIDIILNTSTQAINAVGIVINFDSSKVSVKELNFNKSFCRLFIERIVNNQKGEIRISCGLPTPGFRGRGLVGSFTFEKLSEHVKFAFSSETQVLANDGYGTNVDAQTTDLNITFKPVVQVKKEIKSEVGEIDLEPANLPPVIKKIQNIREPVKIDIEVFMLQVANRNMV